MTVHMATRLKSMAKRCGSLVFGCLSVPFSFVLCCLLIWDIIVSRPRKKKKEAIDLANATAIPFAGTGPRRPLTPGSEASNALAQSRRCKKTKTQSQIQSILFNLPMELRLMIWEASLCGNVFCIERASNDGTRTGGFAKATDKARHYINRPACSTAMTILSNREYPAPQIGGLLSLLLSCRRAYTECLRILYARNTFVVRHSSSIRSGIWKVGRFNFLTRLETSFRIYDIPTRMVRTTHTNVIDWRESWATIASMQQLQYLIVLINCDQFHWLHIDELCSTHEQLILVEPRKVTRPKVWLLYLTWPKLERTIDNDVDVREPFEIRRHHRHSL